AQGSVGGHLRHLLGGLGPGLRHAPLPTAGGTPARADRRARSADSRGSQKDTRTTWERHEPFPPGYRDFSGDALAPPPEAGAGEPRDGRGPNPLRPRAPGSGRSGGGVVLGERAVAVPDVVPGPAGEVAVQDVEDDVPADGEVGGGLA